MQGLQLVYIILPLGLAVVILSLVLILISQLRKEVRLSKLKVVADQYMVKVDSASKLMEGRIGQYSDQLEQRIKDGNAILSRTSAQIADLDGYSQDLSNLKSAMTTYHEALRQLADLTNKSRKELDFLQERSALFSRVQTSISSFQLKFEELSKTMFEREQRMSAVQADFQKGNDEKIAFFEASSNEKAAAMESRIGGLIGAFEARVSSDIKLFDAQISAGIADCKKQIMSDVDSHEQQIKGLKEDNLISFQSKSEEKMKWFVQKLETAFTSVAAATKQLSTELDDKTSALRDIVAGFELGADEKIHDLNERFARLEGEAAELDRILKAKDTALKELDELKQEKDMLGALISEKEKAGTEVGDQSTGVEFRMEEPTAFADVSEPEQEQNSVSALDEASEESAMFDAASSEVPEADVFADDDSDKDMVEDTEQDIEESIEGYEDFEEPEEEIPTDSEESDDEDDLDADGHSSTPADIDDEKKYVPYGESEEIKF